MGLKGKLVNDNEVQCGLMEPELFNGGLAGIKFNLTQLFYD